MRWGFTALTIFVALGGSAFAQDPPPPAVCQTAKQTGAWQACLDALPANSPWRPLALINMGTDSFLRDNYAAAVRYYDEALPPNNQQLLSDITFHTFRGAAYWRVGRREDAQRDADVVYRMLQRDPTLPMPPAQCIPPGLDEEMIYVYILPVMQAGDQQRFNAAVARFRALPAQGWESYANRAGVLQQIGDLPGALSMSERALAAAPNHPAVLNNHCYIVLQMGRAAEAAPFCERAVAAAPGVAAVHHSVAEVYAALGRCADSARELAEARRIDPATAAYQQPLTCTAN